MKTNHITLILNNMHNGAESVGSSNTSVYSRGFTIVELLVVIVVIGILAAITIVSYTGISQRANVASIQSDLSNSSQQLKVFQVLNGVYPLTNNCTAVESSTNICLKYSGTNNLSYSSINSTTPQTFCITASNNGTNYYRITNDSAPISGVCSSASGGTIADIGGYRIHTFTTSGTFTVAGGINNVDVLVVAGGGGGGGSTAGGGGGGGVIYSSSYAVSNQTYSVTIGAGGSGSIRSDQGAANNTNGGNSVFGSLTAVGGGYGFSGYTTGSRLANSGGSGGGAGYYSGNDILISSPGSGTSGQGNSGGTVTANNDWGGAGGGGAGGIGSQNTSPSSTRSGGIGLQSNISGTLKYYGGGGGGGVFNSDSASPGGLGGGGNGGSGLPTIAQNGTPNTGGGGGGGGFYQNGPGGGAGGSGIVIVRYLLP